MKIQELVDIFTSYGYDVKGDKIANIGWVVEQSFKKIENPTTKYDKILRFNWGKRPGPFSDNEASFTLFETESVMDGGIKYEEDGRVYYFYTFGTTPSRIYCDDEIEELTMNIHTEICTRMSSAEVRHIKLISLLNKNANIHT